MADPAKEAATKQRIITHMNNDHASSLAHYSQHYCKLSARQSAGTILKDLDLNGMTIFAPSASPRKEHHIPFDPPMTSFSEARPRVVEMDKASRKALGISSIVIDRYIPPTAPFHAFVFGICGFMFTQFIFYNQITPGTFYYDTVLSYFPGGAETFKWLVRKLALPVLAIHMGEAYLMDRSRLRKYGVQRFSVLWWKWVSSCFIEGFGCFARIDSEVKRKEKEAEKAKH